MKKSFFSAVLVGFALVTQLAAQSAHAMSVDWSGNYRIEWTQIDKTSLDGSAPGRKNYLLNSLQLSPKIIAADGVNIVSKFDVLSNQLYADGQMGQIWGTGGTGTTMGTAANSSDSSAGSNLKVSQLYLNVNQEYGALLAGRAPLEFGLGMTHNAGNGMWDHWQDIHEVVGYKFIIGNFFLMPMLGISKHGTAGVGPSATEMIWHAEYNNPETDSQFGVFHQTRKAAIGANDLDPSIFGGTAAKTGGWNTQHVNIFLARGWEKFGLKVEGGFNSGSTGITVGGEEMSLNGYGVALELSFPRPESKFQYSLLAGVASGDNPDTANYEGFAFDRNYDVAFLMFNHPLGQRDFLRTGTQRPVTGCPTCVNGASGDVLDEEFLSNAMYITPRMNWIMNDKWTWKNSLTWGMLQTKPTAQDPSKDLGFEWDTALVYRPHEKIEWVNELGLLFPGSAFQNGSDGLKKDFTYGFSSKAAISF